MPLASTHYFSSATLRTRYVADLDTALARSRITAEQHQWLGLLADPVQNGQSAVDAPRVDQIVVNSGAKPTAELAGAVLLSHHASLDGAVYLHTLLDGIEPFASRQLLLHALDTRFRIAPGVASAWEYESVEGDPFEWRMRSIIGQHGQALVVMADHLMLLPSLHTAVGRAFQHTLEQALPETTLNVFTHLLQIVRVPGSAEADSNPVVMGTRTLAEAAMAERVRGATANELHRRYLGETGRVLTSVQAQPFENALAGVRAATKDCYEELLESFWSSAVTGGGTRREFGARFLADTFHHRLLTAICAGDISSYEGSLLRRLHPASRAGASESRLALARLSVSVADGEPVKLVGIFLVELAAVQLPGMLLYSAKHGLRRFASIAQLIGHFTSTAGRAELLEYSSLNDHPLLAAPGELSLHRDALDRPLFADLMDSIIAWQKRNLAHAIDLPCEHVNQAAVIIDDALDIRQLLNPGLVSLGGSGRWREQGLDFEHAWPELSGHDRAVLPEGAREDEALRTWQQYLVWVKQEVDRTAGLHPGVTECARRVLNQYLSIFSEVKADASELWVKPPDAAVVKLVDLLLNRITGHVLTRLADDSQVLSQVPGTMEPRVLATLTARMLELILDLADGDFRQQLALQSLRSHSRQLRQLNTQILPAKVGRDIRSSLLRLALRIEKQFGKFNAQSLAMLEQVLDRPSLSLRAHFGDTATEVYALHVVYPPNFRPEPMTGVFVLRQPLVREGKLLLCSLNAGLQECKTRSDLQAFINGKLADPATKTQWLACFSSPSIERIDAYLQQSLSVRIGLERVDENFIEHFQGIELERQIEEVEAACDNAVRWKADAALMDKLVGTANADDNVREMADNLSYTLEVTFLEAFVPQWVNDASSRDLQTLSELLLKAYVTQDPEQDFLFDIPSLEQHARDLILVRLKKDFAGQSLDPDKIVVRLTRYVGAPSLAGEIPSSMPAATQVDTQTLTQFAINRFGGAQDVTLSIALEDGYLAAPLPGADYVSDLVRDLDVGASFQTLLAEKLDVHDPEHARRVRMFAACMPAWLILGAFELKLQKLLSEKALRYVRGIMLMPDGLARLPVDGEQVVLSPLQLVAEPGRAADVVTGLYLITAQDSTNGPWILYSMLADHMQFKEYANEAALLAAIQNSSSLQALILEYLDPQARRIYDNGGFIEPHLPWSTEVSMDVPVFRPAAPRILIQPVRSNALSYLFEGMKSVLMLNARRASVTTAQFNQQANRFLLSLGGEQALALLPGRLGLLVGAWQSHSWLKATAQDLGERQWGRALSEFSTAVATLISWREDPKETRTRAVHEPSVEERSLSTLDFSWGNSGLTPDLRNRLRQLEADNVSLSELEKDDLFGVYRSRRTRSEFVAVEGKVYQITFTQTGYRIVKDDVLGPSVRADENRQWTLDLQGGLRGGGGIQTRLSNFTFDHRVDQILIVEARGMPEIRRLFPDRARRIAEAHLGARNLLRIARDNLQSELSTGQISARARQVVGGFFGVKTPSERLIASIIKRIAELQEVLLDQSLSPFTSERIIVGTNKMGAQDSSAFTFSSDARKRIYLTERFFRSPVYRLKPPVIGQNGFNIAAHFRTTILLHELSHVANNSHDIAYVESSAPYLDLIYDGGDYYRGLKRRYEHYQQHCLSFMTAREDLFKDTTSDELPRDLLTSDGDARLTILKITGKETLEEARDVFYADADKRSDIMLSNADSITLLVTLLGRERFDMSPT